MKINKSDKLLIVISPVQSIGGAVMSGGVSAVYSAV